MQINTYRPTSSFAASTIIFLPYAHTSACIATALPCPRLANPCCLPTRNLVFCSAATALSSKTPVASWPAAECNMISRQLDKLTWTPRLPFSRFTRTVFPGLDIAFTSAIPGCSEATQGCNGDKVQTGETTPLARGSQTSLQAEKTVDVAYITRRSWK